MSEEIKIKICKICGISNENNRCFNGYKCQRCQSAINNQKLKERNYYKSYYIEKNVYIKTGVKRGPKKQEIN
jgi:hypothetical protein